MARIFSYLQGKQVSPAEPRPGLAGPENAASTFGASVVVGRLPPMYHNSNKTRGSGTNKSNRGVKDR